jgi:hypothetical protein
MEEAATPSSKDCKYSSFLLINIYMLDLFLSILCLFHMNLYLVYRSIFELISVE